MNRRSFLQFLGRTAAISSVVAPTALLNACRPPQKNNLRLPFTPLTPTNIDAVTLAQGFEYQIIVQWKDAISATENFGFNNDYLAFLPLQKNNLYDGLLWVNHEYIDQLFISNFKAGDTKTVEQVKKEQYEVGGSIIRIKKVDNTWQLVKNDPYNRRITAQTPIKFAWHEPIANATQAIGTLGNCAGGVTPWGTILTCEENYDACYGETSHITTPPTHINSVYGWEKFFNYPPEHYGWVVEINLKTGEAQKLIALGRCAHECATTFKAPNGKVVVYTGDDANNECLYKFISKKNDSLTEGTLYVANIQEGKWISLDINEQPILQQHFKSQTEVLIRLRQAAKLVGGSPLDRPEDIEIDPLTGNIFVSLTNNIPKGNYNGSILKITEHDNTNKTSLTFTAETYLTGGADMGFACPDNLAFDAKGNLWFTSDMAGYEINKGTYKGLANNGLFVVPAYGSHAGKVIQVASAPIDAEFTGPCFAPDGKTLFLSVQHPGETTTDLNNPTSSFPNGKGNIPKPVVIAISGSSLNFFTQ